jgi:hypothetical protein
MDRVMRRWLLRAIGLLVLGFAVSLIVAVSIWLSAGGPPPPDPLGGPWIDYPVSKADLAIWRRCRSVGWPEQPDWAYWDEFTFGRSCRHLLAITGGFNRTGLSHEEWDRRARSRSFYNVDVVETGWPTHSLAIEFWFEIHYPNPITKDTGGLQLGRVLLPRRFLWRGVILDTLFYSCLIGLVAFGAPQARACLRRVRGRCPKCAYDLRGRLAEGCPECGWRRSAVDEAQRQRRPSE